MVISNAEEILVVILSITLAVFLALAITATIILIKILKNIKRVTEKAEAIADKADNVTTFFQQTAGPAAIAKLVANFIDAAKRKKED